jgi:dTDP-4-dehydrorhamnose 3,5-epimerase
VERAVTDAAAIAGVELTPLKQITDARGAVLHMLRADAPGFTTFGECYFSIVNPGVVKAWKRHLRQTQNVAVPVGRARFVLCDTRADSSTRGRVLMYELGRPDSYLRLRIPPLVWYGFACIGDVAALVANCADIPHDPAEGESVPVDAFEVHGALEVLRTGREGS